MAPIGIYLRLIYIVSSVCLSFVRWHHWEPVDIVPCTRTFGRLNQIVKIENFTHTTLVSLRSKGDGGDQGGGRGGCVERVAGGERGRGKGGSGAIGFEVGGEPAALLDVAGMQQALIERIWGPYCLLQGHLFYWITEMFYTFRVRFITCTPTSLGGPH